MFWSKLLEYLTRYLFANIKLLLEHRDKILSDFSWEKQTISFLAISPNTLEELEKVGQCFQGSIHFNLGHPRPKITNASFYVEVGLLLTKLNHHFNDSDNTNVFFGHSK